MVTVRKGGQDGDYDGSDGFDDGDDEDDGGNDEDLRAMRKTTM